MRVRTTKASGSFKCDREGSFELLVHMEADSRTESYAEFNFDTILTAYQARELSDFASFTLRHSSGLYVISAEPTPSRLTSRYRRYWNEADAVLAQRDIWLFSASIEHLRREPNWSRACEIARCAHADIHPRDQERVVDYLSSVGHAPVRECAKLCTRSADSLDALFKLVSAGILYLDSDDLRRFTGTLRLQPLEIAPEGNAISWLQSPSPARKNTSKQQ